MHDERLCLAVHRSHRFAEQASIGAADLAGEPLIAAPAEDVPTLRHALVGYCRSGGVEPTIRLEDQLQQTAVSLVGEGLGSALVPSSMAKAGLPDVVFRELADAPLVAHVVAWRATNLNPTLRPFLAGAGVAPRTEGAMSDMET